MTNEEESSERLRDPVHITLITCCVFGVLPWVRVQGSALQSVQGSKVHNLRMYLSFRLTWLCALCVSEKNKSYTDMPLWCYTEIGLGLVWMGWGMVLMGWSEV